MLVRRACHFGLAWLCPPSLTLPSCFPPTSSQLDCFFAGFTCDENRFIHVMRLFIGQPIWTPFNRPQEDHPSRKRYVAEYLEEKKQEG